MAVGDDGAGQGDDAQHPEAAVPAKGVRPSVESVALDLVGWLSDVWVPLAGYTFALAAAYWFEFRREYGIAVSFGSSGTLSALPALAAMLIGAVVLVAAYLLLPSVALWLPAGEDGRRLLDGHRSDADAARAAGKTGRDAPMSDAHLGRHWLGVQGVGAMGTTIVYFLHRVDGIPSVLRFLIDIVPIAVSVVLLQPACTNAGIRGVGRVWMSLVITWAMGLQWLIVMHVLSVTDATVHGSGFLATATCWLLGISFIVLVISFQFLVSAGAVLGPMRVSGRGVVLMVLALAALPLAVPSLAAELAAVPLRITDPSGNNCVVLVPSSRANAADWAPLMPAATTAPAPTRPLAFAVLFDAYHVKVVLGGETMVLAQDQVQAIRGCPLPKP